jgi:hypothetical protein
MRFGRFIFMSLSGAYAKIGALQLDITNLQRRLNENETKMSLLIKKAPEAHWKHEILLNLEKQEKILENLRGLINEQENGIKLIAVFLFLCFSSFLTYLSA